MVAASLRLVRTSVTAAAAARAESTQLRLTFLGLLVISLFVLLFARLWFLQVMAGERYVELAETNAVRTVSIEAPRGRILDRDGEPIVQNRYAKVVSVQPAEMGDREEEVLADVADLLDLPVDEVTERIERSRVSPLRPRPIAVDVPDEVVFYIHENGADRFPGVYAETLPFRDYPHGETAAHVVGYVGEISEAELAQAEYEDYRQGEMVGWAGLERIYQSELRGREGMRRLEVDARGRVVRNLEETLPVPGADLRTTLDLDAQQLTEEALADGIAMARTIRDERTDEHRGETFAAPAGAAVVQDPDNGEVLAMASFPSFDPDVFVGGVSNDDWARLQDPDGDFPLINRVIQSAYPPGSVFKVVSAAAALEDGYMSQSSTLPCPPSWEWNRAVFRNWRTTHSGDLNLSDALVESCDTVFYEIARRMWTDEQEEGDDPRERLTEQSFAWGFGVVTGIDLPSERPGVIPGRGWRREFWETHRDVYCTKAAQLEEGTHAQEVNADLCEDGHRWRGGDAVNMVIGQGDVQTTPLQVNNAFAALANGGTLYRPRLGKEILHRNGLNEETAPEVIGELPVSEEHLAYIEDGLLGVTASGGTAAATFADFPVPVAGKTGTAEMKPKQPFAWFSGYAPADDPEYVVTAMVEEGGGGSQTAAPIVRRVLEGLLDVAETEIDPGQETD